MEGGEGAGKSSVLLLLNEWLQSQGHDVMTTREPGGIRIAEEIRAVIHNRSHTSMDGMTEALLYAAARRQHLSEKVIPALQKGQVVLCDRFVDSSLAYQGYARGLGLEEIWQINQFAINGLMPDLTIFMDITPEKGLARIRAHGDREINRLDLEELSFHQRVREGYLLLLERFPERIIKVNADQEIGAVFEEVKRILRDRLGL